MKTSKYSLASVFLLSIVILAGCSSTGSEFLGAWVNTRNANDTFQIVRNGDQYLIVNKDSKVGATYDKGMLEIKSILGSAELTYDRKTDTILAPGFFGEIEYKRMR
jgi:hypothetical protein